MTEPRRAAEKRPSAALSGHLTVLAAWQESLLIRRDATPHPSSLRSLQGSAGASLLRIACLTGREKPRGPCTWAFLSNLQKIIFSATC